MSGKRCRPSFEDLLEPCKVKVDRSLFPLRSHSLQHAQVISSNYPQPTSYEGSSPRNANRDEKGHSGTRVSRSYGERT